MKNRRQKIIRLLELLWYAIILSALINTLVLLADIYCHGASYWIEPNTNILILEIGLIIYAIVFTIAMIMQFMRGK